MRPVAVQLDLKHFCNAENKYTHLTAENEKKDSEIRRLNRAVHTYVALRSIPPVQSKLLTSLLALQLEAAKADRDKVQEDVTLRNARIEEVR